ncbi:MAG: hypothetical protein EBQ89_09820, partial [Alphaproteobacteria bacterium]|nr:hypothetical protein [Alphaproteobacteria bacterium]
MANSKGAYDAYDARQHIFFLPLVGGAGKSYTQCMELICPSCQARYMVKDDLFQAGPKVVRCQKCNHRWRQGADGVVDDGLPKAGSPAASSDAAAALATPSSIAPSAGAPHGASAPSAHATNQPHGGNAPASTPPREVHPDHANWFERHDFHMPRLAAVRDFLHMHYPHLDWHKIVYNITHPVGLKQALRASWVMVGVLVVSILVVALMQRVDISQRFPFMAGAYRAVGLSLGKPGHRLLVEDVMSEQRADAGQIFIDISGQIVNQASYAQPVGHLTVQAFGADDTKLAEW